MPYFFCFFGLVKKENPDRSFRVGILNLNHYVVLPTLQGAKLGLFLDLAKYFLQKFVKSSYLALSFDVLRHKEVVTIPDYVTEL